MRRGINNRKKKKFLLQEINKKSFKLLIILSCAILICIFIYFFFIKNIFIKNNFEKDNLKVSNLNENIPFSLNKIILFSSATADTDNVNQSVLSLDISQYCDIGLYLNNLNKENTVIKSLYINNFNISSPQVGKPCLYKKVVSDLGNCSYEESKIISERFDFNIIDSGSKINYMNYELYSDGSTPISIGFYNKDVKTDFLADVTEITYNGKLLQRALIPITSLNCNISFTLNIITTNDEHYICNINFDIPFTNADNSSIYDDGYATKEISNTQIDKFIRIK